MTMKKYRVAWVDSVNGGSYSDTFSSYAQACRVMKNLVLHGMPATLSLIGQENQK